jgi:hypothetical protein
MAPKGVGFDCSIFLNFNCIRQFLQSLPILTHSMRFTTIQITIQPSGDQMFSSLIRDLLTKHIADNGVLETTESFIAVLRDVADDLSDQGLKEQAVEAVEVAEKLDHAMGM